MKFLLTLKIPKKITQEIDAYRKKYHPSGLSHLSSHVTLTPPFVLKGRLVNLVEDVEKRCSAASQFNMVINGIGWFGNDVLFFKPNCPPKLRKFQADLKKFIDEKYRKKDHGEYWEFKTYHPHITIAHCDEKKIKQYKEELQGLRYKKHFTVTGVELYARRKDKKWILKKEFLFQK